MNKKSILDINSSCEECRKCCKWRGLTVAEKSEDHSKYGCNTSKTKVLR